MALVNSVNPYRIEGQKTAAFEVVEDLGDAPDYLCIPVGNAGNITAYWKGFCEYREAGLASGRPRMMGFQAAGAAPLVHGTPVEDPQTVASAIRIGNPASWDGAIRARDESGGAIGSVTDDEILDAYRSPGPSGGHLLRAGLRRLAWRGWRSSCGRERTFRDKTVVCVLTGTGLKDPEAAEVAGRSAACRKCRRTWTSWPRRCLGADAHPRARARRKRGTMGQLCRFCREARAPDSTPLKTS